ncbi:FtsK/SpoIIIE domain-containing protein [Leptolyngbya sp. AN03gr2]|uniref:FtsK/SpoIIIE domain-containing protein n=1 Tax=Leptolyngbya sp. AN03gr2 TaxID=3423364 RepID=UPI003D313800
MNQDYTRGWLWLCDTIEAKHLNQVADARFQEFIEQTFWKEFSPQVFTTELVNECFLRILEFLKTQDVRGLQLYKSNPPMLRTSIPPSPVTAIPFPSTLEETSEQKGLQRASAMADRIVTASKMFKFPLRRLVKNGEDVCVHSAPRLWILRFEPDNPPIEEMLEKGITPVDVSKIRRGLPNLIVYGELPENPEPIVEERPGCIEFQIPKDEDEWEPCDLTGNRYIQTIKRNRFYECDALDTSMGLDTTGEIVDIEFIHLLIAGETGAGKTSTVNALVSALMFRYAPRQLQWVFIDVAKTLSKFNDTPGFWQGVQNSTAEYPTGIRLKPEAISNPKRAMEALDALLIEYEQRLNILHRAKVDSIGKFNRKFPDETLPRIALYIDEYADFRDQVGHWIFSEIEDPTVRRDKGREELDAKIVRMARGFRKVGIHLIIATQRPSVDNITMEIRDNLPTRIALKCSSEGASKMLFGTTCNLAVNLLGKGDFWLIHNGTRRRCQSFYVDDEKIVHSGMTILDLILDGYRKKYKLWAAENRSEEIPDEIWNTEAEHSPEEKKIYDKLRGISGSRRDKIRAVFGVDSGPGYTQRLKEVQALEDKFGSLEK